VLTGGISARPLVDEYRMRVGIGRSTSYSIHSSSHAERSINYLSVCRPPIQLWQLTTADIWQRHRAARSSELSSDLFRLTCGGCRDRSAVRGCSGESKPNAVPGPQKNPKSVPGPQNVRIFTGTFDSSPVRGPMH